MMQFTEEAPMYIESTELLPYQRSTELIHIHTDNDAPTHISSPPNINSMTDIRPTHHTYKPSKMDRKYINDGFLRPTTFLRNVATWNIEGFSDEELAELEIIMDANSIDILCIQETHTQGSEHYVAETGALVI